MSLSKALCNFAIRSSRDETVLFDILLLVDLCWLIPNVYENKKMLMVLLTRLNLLGSGRVLLRGPNQWSYRNYFSYLLTFFWYRLPTFLWCLVRVCVDCTSDFPFSSGNRNVDFLSSFSSRLSNYFFLCIRKTTKNPCLVTANKSVLQRAFF